MATNNAINKDFPLSVAEGGTGNVSLLDHGILLGNGSSPFTTIPVGTSGTVLITEFFSFSWGNELNNNFSIRTGSAGNNPVLTVSNTDNTSSATSSARILVSSGGASAGSPYVSVDPAVGSDWVLSSTTSSFFIAVGGNAAWQIDTSGALNKPDTSAISVQNNTARSNITGGGATYQIPYDLTNYDQRGNYGPPTFTAPIDGTYLIVIGCNPTNIDVGAGGCPRMYAPTQIVGAMQTYVALGRTKTGASELAWSTCVIYNLDAADTIRSGITFFNGAASTDLLARNATFMSVTLLG